MKGHTYEKLCSVDFTEEYIGMGYSFKHMHLLLIMGHRQQDKCDQDNFLYMYLFEHLL